MADDVVVDATIQRFEFTYELSWKLMTEQLHLSISAKVTSVTLPLAVAFSRQPLVKPLLAKRYR
ncbi:MAG: nucleotidyltransferase substrate binding protein, partial [Bacillota bacterium]|nr:nucleotidyltransferase substrate binding protein [Bacillota bacterium]